ncbi:hypothetical protein FT663_02585 [Candidozyma haemuli var. vulneris]|uniref:25S rRNA adenine-N(1) methyltransferase n=1 Tax=Candidozyma haemuli TaxID=45357 RepID=A0A2V1AWI6_9ASCO|nr:hypothetical protein CXQ85_005026 [[Candida] haemuloni]KAF3986703.1 hypothetical protein FT662_04403 [[Candida] haemuloni var. vulneris]KAF3991834.1 hypothetical protein FT663_02585 [[Candida] haemuloni var. vulneris]PVH22457.1 hypothetical protein CXQ85_005026 [[Candida] haemuloni]
MLKRPRTISASADKQRKPKLKPQKARKIIRRFHVLQKNKAALLKLLDLDESNYINRLGKTYTEQFEQFKLGKKPELFKFDSAMPRESLGQMVARIDKEVELRGGLHIYQMASTVGQASERGGDSSKKLVEWYRELGRSAGRSLEIGCLSPNNSISTSGLFGEVTRIDLNSQDSKILQQDFMERPLPESDRERFNVISCSLVLNFVPSAEQRGQMLRRMTQFLLSPVEGNPSSVFMVLPLPCVSNSRYMSRELFLDIMERVGFSQVKYHEANKVAYWLFDWSGKRKVVAKKEKKREILSGSTRNNFYVAL